MASTTSPTASQAVLDGMLGQAAEEYAAEIQQGRRPKLAEFAARYPDISDLIEQVFPALELMNAVFDFPSRDEEDDKIAPACPQRLRRLGDFQIGKEIGRGGMGIVFEAVQSSLERTVAVKILPFAAMLDERAILRFQNEARAAATLEHPNIVSVHDCGFQHGVYYYAMSLIRGRPLSEVIQACRRHAAASSAESKLSLRDLISSPAQVAADAKGEPTAAANATIGLKPPPIDQALAARRPALQAGPDFFSREYFEQVALLGIQAAEALHHAHSQGIVHRDIKPGNLLVDGEAKLWVADFGLARIESDPGVTLTGDLVGTLRYMAPEQALARRIVVDHRADIYGLGATLYELIALRALHDGDDKETILRQIAFEEPESLLRRNPWTPRDLDTVIRKAVSKLPDERYATAQEFADDLGAFLRGQPIAAQPPTAWRRFGRWCRRNTNLVATACLALLVLTGALAISNAMVANQRNIAVRAVASERRLRTEANRQRRAAEEARRLAEQRRAAATQAAYDSEMRFAFQKWAQREGDATQSLLDAQVPEAGEPDTRDVAWRVLQTFVDMNFVKLGEHDGPVNDIAVFPDRRRCATVGEDGRIRIWDIDARSLLVSWQVQDSPIYAVAVSPDGKLLAYGAGRRDKPQPKRVILLDAESGEPRGECCSHENTIRRIRFSPDGRRLASSSVQDQVRVWEFADGVAGREIVLTDDRAPEYFDFHFIGRDQLWTEYHSRRGYRLWDLTTGAAVRDYRDLSEENVSAAAFNPRDSVVAFVANERRRLVRLIDIATGKEAGSVDALESVTCMEFLRDGRRLRLGTTTGKSRTYDVIPPAADTPGPIQLKLVRSVKAHRGGVTCLRFVGLNRCVSGGVDGQVILQRGILGWRPSFSLKHNESSPDPTQIKYSPDNQFLAVGYEDGSVAVLDHATGQVLSRSSSSGSPVLELAWSGDAESVAAVCLSGVIRCWPRGELSAAPCFETTTAAYSFHSVGLALSRDGTRIYSTGAAATSGVTAWDVAAATRIQTTPTIYELREAILRPDDRLLVVASSQGIFVFDTQTMKLLHHLQQGGPCYCVLFAPDQRTLLAGYRDGAIRRWDPENGELLETLTEYESKDCTALSLQLSPDGRTLLAGDNFGRIRLWNAQTWRHLGAIQVFPTNWWAQVAHLGFSPDGRELEAGLAVAGPPKQPNRRELHCIPLFRDAPDAVWRVE